MVYVILFALSLVLIGSCVSKKDYLVKVEEGQKLSNELTALKVEHDQLKGEKEALDRRVMTLELEREDLEEARVQLQLKNLSLENEVAALVSDNAKLEEILRAKSDTLSKHIVDLRGHIASLKDENDFLNGENEHLKQKVDTLAEHVNALQSQVTALEAKNVTLQSDSEAQIGHLQSHILALEERNRVLKSEAETQAGRFQKQIHALKEENKLLQSESEAQIYTLQNQILELEEENEALQYQAEAREREREEELLEMKGAYEGLLENMKSEIAKGKITITQLRGKLKVNMVDEILFDSGKTTIKAQGVEVLKRVGNILLTVKDRAINIEGHTDNIPIGAELSKKYTTNWELSAARATTVARYLQEKIGIDPSLLSATGHGEYQPIASNETQEERARNRRIEIVLVPKEIVSVSRK